MNETTGGPGGFDEAMPDVTEIPLRELDPEEDRVLDAAIRRLVADIVNQREITAGFGSIS
ncbi:hypothetical protein ACQP2E_25645 [Actinoplanes sp. CA-015351]|uniref:hypothetical protein n=1 Tax=Actinoplanes sp. CA-015351 TaxID=3239897 RepID=UPI003D9638C3